MLAEGMTNRQEFANEMFLAEKTVKNYVSNMLTKLGVSRRTEAAVYAGHGIRPDAVRTLVRVEPSRRSWRRAPQACGISWISAVRATSGWFGWLAEDVVLHIVVVDEPQFAVGAGVRLLVHGSDLSTLYSSPSSVGGIQSAVIAMAPPPARGLDPGATL